jgi:hypothetical protein
MVAQPSPVPFQPYRKVQVGAERDMRAILESTSKAIATRIARLPIGIGGDVRKAQLVVTLAAIKRAQHSMWTGPVRDTIVTGVDDAQKAAESAIETMTRVAYASLSDAAAEALVRGLRLSAEAGLKAESARKIRELSSRVYHQAALHEGKVEQLIREGLIAGLSARELAATVHSYISPTTPGGSSYAAMRLARTEINNAFHERQLQGAKRPGVTAVKWNLSGSHRVPDLCNVYASHGKGSGEWMVDAVPDKPHPQCFCYLTYITASPEEFQKRLAAGSFDDEIDARTRANLARLGQPTSPREGKPKPTKASPSSSALPKTQVAALDKFNDGMTRDEWHWDAGANLNAIDALIKKKMVVRDGKKTVIIHGQEVQHDTYRLASPSSSKTEPTPIVKDDPLNRVEGEGRDRVQRVLNEQRAFVPNSMRRFNGVRKMSPTEAKSFAAQYGKTALGGYTVQTSEIAIHPQVLTSAYERQFSRELKNGFLSKCGHNHGAVESFIAHETGHHVDKMMGLSGTTEKKVVWRAVAEALGLKPPLLMDAKSLDRWVEKNQAVIAKKVSTYGSENAAELLAEVWAEYTTNDSPRAHVKAIGKAMQTLAERIA